MKRKKPIPKVRWFETSADGAIRVYDSADECVFTGYSYTTLTRWAQFNRITLERKTGGESSTKSTPDN